MNPAVVALFDELGPLSRRHRLAVAALATGPRSIADLIELTALSRRSIEQLLAALGDDVPQPGDGVVDGLHVSAWSPTSPDEDDVARLAARLAPYVSAVPRPLKDLDHVQATAESVARRALWLAGEYHLPGARLAFIGDHDLTSLAVALVEPSAFVSVVDVDERLLGFLSDALADVGTGSPSGPAQHILRYADLRAGLPGDLAGANDLFVTDPPYTPDGVGLFVARGLESLTSLVHGRGHVAYGYSELKPTLGLHVQRAIMELDCVFSQVLPHFGRYDGAQAVGSASDWYVLQPTPRTAARLRRRRERVDTETESDRRIYSHGAQSVESQAEVPLQVAEHAALLDRYGEDVPFIDLARGLDVELFRTLLVTTADRLLLLVPNNHPDVSTAAGLQCLREDLRGVYDVQVARSFPAARLAVVDARRPARRLAPDDVLRARFLGSPSSSLGTALAEALMKALRVKGVKVARSVIRTRLEHAGTMGQISPSAIAGDLSRADLRTVLARAEELLDAW